MKIHVVNVLGIIMHVVEEGLHFLLYIIFYR